MGQIVPCRRPDVHLSDHIDSPRFLVDRKGSFKYKHMGVSENVVYP